MTQFVTVVDMKLGLFQTFKICYQIFCSSELNFQSGMVFISTHITKM